MFNQTGTSSDQKEFLEQTKSARRGREERKCHQAASVAIQAGVRGFLARARLKKRIRKEFDEFFGDESDDGGSAANKEVTLQPAVEVYRQIKALNFIFTEKEDAERFDVLCKYVLNSMSSRDPKLSYVGVAFQSRYVVDWLTQLRAIVVRCATRLRDLRPEYVAEGKRITRSLLVLITFTSTDLWLIFPKTGGEALRANMNKLCENVLSHLNKNSFFPILQTLLTKGLARAKPAFKKTQLVAIVTLALRMLQITQKSENTFTMFLLHVMSVPALIRHLEMLAPDALSTLTAADLFAKSLDLLSNDQNTRIVFNSLEGNYALCLLANLIHLGSLQSSKLQEQRTLFTNVITKLLESCRKYVQLKKSNLTHWHPVLGYFAQRTDSGLHEAMPFVKSQLQLLWSLSMIKTLFEPLFKTTESSTTSSTLSTKSVSTDEALGAAAGGSAVVSSSSSSSKVSSLHQSPLPPPSSNGNGRDARPKEAQTSSSSSSKNLLKKAFEKVEGKASSLRSSSLLASHQRGGISQEKLDSPELASICAICGLYQMALLTLTQMRLDILTGLCAQDILLPLLWGYVRGLGPSCGIKTLLDLLSQSPKNAKLPVFQLLMLFCDCSSHVITIVDDFELYDQNKPFSCDDLMAIGAFLNQFVFRLMSLVDLSEPLFISAYHLLMHVYDRDCRRQFARPNHWLIKDVKPASFLSNLERGEVISKILIQHMPHIIPHKDRVMLLRKHVYNEKAVLGLLPDAEIGTSPPSTLITIHRSRLIEDGYRQLAALPTQSLKGVIRVKFINEQGLDEAGIDQDGVFKEFLEETIKRVFDPSLNLFRITNNQKLYPSTTSHLQDNHLLLFEFVGKMLAKAIYEGIVVDVPFATFFLTQVMGHHRSHGFSHNYSSIDELPSLDPDLYKSLTFIKRYEGDVEDLELNFSFDEDIMGKIVTHELMPGGKSIPVTNSNKISYVHRMADFRMRVQIREQTSAFIRGFKSIVAPDWLEMFSAPELQKLISGDADSLDIEDLKKHTQYYGGFHGSHRVVQWLWEILDEDLTPDEKGLFLKFVTSCSKPPLLGFAHLEPPFSIRCVEVSDDQDTGDTLGSVLKGFFHIRGRREPVGRLPTSSTCFNLLKLPNYSKKATLREKLKYAIYSNTGFELS